MDFNPSNLTSLAELWHADRALLPTDLSAAQLRQLDAEIRQASLFSARTTNAQYLQQLRTWIAAILKGDVNEATARYQLQLALQALGYTPAGGFPEDDKALQIPPAEKGSLQDLMSEERLKLILNTQRQMANGFGLLTAGSSELALYRYPAWELTRHFSVEVPRGERRGAKGTIVEVPGDDWPSRFEKAGGTLINGRCLALKDDEVWQNLGSSEIFDDGLDNPFPPFWFNSGGGWDPIDRETALELGLLEEDDESPAAPAAAGKPFSSFVTLDGQSFDKDILTALAASLKAA